MLRPEFCWSKAVGVVPNRFSSNGSKLRHRFVGRHKLTKKLNVLIFLKLIEKVEPVETL